MQSKLLNCQVNVTTDTENWNYRKDTNESSMPAVLNLFVTANPLELYFFLTTDPPSIPYKTMIRVKWSLCNSKECQHLKV